MAPAGPGVAGRHRRRGEGAGRRRKGQGRSGHRAPGGRRDAPTSLRGSRARSRSARDPGPGRRGHRQDQSGQPGGGGPAIRRPARLAALTAIRVLSPFRECPPGAPARGERRRARRRAWVRPPRRRRRSGRPRATRRSAGAEAPAAKVYTGDDLAAYGGSESELLRIGRSLGRLVRPGQGGPAAYNAAMEDWLAAGKDKAALGPRPTGRDRSAQDQWDRRNRDAERRYREAQEAIAAARQNVDALEERGPTTAASSGETPAIRLPLKADGEAGPGISPQERTWRDRGRLGPGRGGEGRGQPGGRGEGPGRPWVRRRETREPRRR